MDFPVAEKVRELPFDPDVAVEEVVESRPQYEIKAPALSGELSEVEVPVYPETPPVQNNSGAEGSDIWSSLPRVIAKKKKKKRANEHTATDPFFFPDE